MTVIAYRDGILAADSQVSASGLNTSTVVKAWRTDDGSRWAFSGTAGYQSACVAWSKGPRDGEAPKIVGSGLIQITPDGAVRELCESGWIDGQVAEFFAWGSGEQVATGAMAAGATAVEAVEIACRLIQGCGPPLTILEP